MNWSRFSVGALTLGVAALCMPVVTLAATHIVQPGQSIQAAVDAAAPNDTVLVMPGDYTETHGNQIAVRITKSLKLYAKSKLPDTKVRLLPGAGNIHGIVVEPVNPGVDPDVTNVRVKGFTVEGFSKNGIWLRYVDRYKIEGNESINNLENGIWPTLSANGLVKKNLSYGSEDAALWIEASENVRVIGNELHSSPTGLEVTISTNVKMVKNNIYNNTVGVGLYHPTAAGLPAEPPYTQYGNWILTANNVHDNNFVNTAPPGSMSSALPPGIGVLVLGVDRVTMRRNTITGNGSVGIGMLDWCLGVADGPFDCTINPPEVADTVPDENRFIANTVTGNGTNIGPGFPAVFAGDFLALGGVDNCYNANVTTIPPLFPLEPKCG